MAVWKVKGDGRTVPAGEVVKPDERLNLPAMLGLGGQHILAMFGATALVPVLTGFPVTTTIFFSGIGTILFNLITRNRVPSYTGSSFAFIAPVIAAKAESGVPAALGGIVVAGVVLGLIGFLVDRKGFRVIELMTEENLDPLIGRSFMGDGVATTLSGLFGGSGTTTYAENIGVMRFFQPEEPGFGDPLVEPLAQTPDPRRS